jgi:hypothetical protein
MESFPFPPFSSCPALKARYIFLKIHSKLECDIDRGNWNCQGLITLKWMREER